MKLSLYIAIFSLLFCPFSNVYAQNHHHGGEKDAPSLSLVEIMQGMDESLSELSSAIMNDDFELITASAHNIAHHPSISKEDLHTLFEKLGDKKEGFITCDTEVHTLAVDVAMAGKEEDMVKVLESHATMMAKATECHDKYR